MPVSALKESDLLNRKGSFSEEGVLGLKNMALVSEVGKGIGAKVERIIYVPFLNFAACV